MKNGLFFLHKILTLCNIIFIFVSIILFHRRFCPRNGVEHSGSYQRQLDMIYKPNNQKINLIHKTMNIKKLITKYLLIVIALAIIKGLLIVNVPDLYSKTIAGEGFIQIKHTFFSIYQTNIFNLILGAFMSFDLYKTGRFYILIPVLTVLSATTGLIFFSIVLLHHLIHKHEQI